MARYALDLNETADASEYVQLEFKVREGPLTDDGLVLAQILAALNSSDAFIVARPPSKIVHGASTLGFSASVTEAVVRTTAGARDRIYRDVLAPVLTIGGSFLVPASATLATQYYVDNSATDTFLTNGSAPPLLKTGQAPSPVDVILNSDPANPLSFTGLGNVGNSLASAASTTGTVIEALTAAVVIGSVAWLVMEWKR